MSTGVDAVVAGGGPAGAVAALTLARAGRRVLLAERRSAERFKIGEALPGAARPLLRDLGLWDQFVADGHLPSYGVSAAWGTSAPLDTDFIHDPNGHGWHVDRSRFEAFLRTAACAAGVEWLEGVGIRVAGSELRLDGARRGCVRPRMLIDATGRPAALARRLGGRRRRGDRLVAVYAVFEAVAGDLDTRTLLEATADGWWYTALVPGARRVVAFLTDADLVAPGLRSRDGFLRALSATEHLDVRVAADPLLGPRTVPAHGAWLEPAAGAGWLAVGDAALALDPLSSQGLLTALFTGLTAGRAVDGELDGRPGAIDGYRARLTAIRGAYQRHRIDAYRLESRWHDRPFWARRA